MGIVVPVECDGVSCPKCNATDEVNTSVVTNKGVAHFAYICSCGHQWQGNEATREVEVDLSQATQGLDDPNFGQTA